MADGKKADDAKRDPAVIDLEEQILGKEEFAARRAKFPEGITRVVRKLTDAERATIRNAKLLKNTELAKHFRVSVTTIANIRSGK